jgi:hypothetical protein
LNPGIEDGFPDGEVFRNELILATLASTVDEAEQHLQQRLLSAQELISKQSRRFREFENGLEMYLGAAFNRADLPIGLHH